MGQSNVYSKLILARVGQGYDGGGQRRPTFEAIQLFRETLGGRGKKVRKRERMVRRDSFQGAGDDKRSAIQGRIAIAD